MIFVVPVQAKAAENEDSKYEKIKHQPRSSIFTSVQKLTGLNLAF
jgi:hypothetical protein